MIIPIVALAMSKSSIESRAKDWRNGAVIYQVFIDRFVPPVNREEKAKFFASPRTFKPWDELPKGGKFDPKAGVWTHELDSGRALRSAKQDELVSVEIGELLRSAV